MFFVFIFRTIIIALPAALFLSLAEFRLILQFGFNSIRSMVFVQATRDCEKRKLVANIELLWHKMSFRV